MPYINALYCAAIPSLADRREQLSRKFCKLVQEPSPSLSSLLPNQWSPSITTRLRSANKFPKHYRHLFPTLSLIIKLHNHSTIYFIILFGVLFLHFYYLFIALSFAVYVFIVCCAIWFYDHRIQSVGLHLTKCSEIEQSAAEL